MRRRWQIRRRYRRVVESGIGWTKPRVCMGSRGRWYVPSFKRVNKALANVGFVRAEINSPNVCIIHCGLRCVRGGHHHLFLGRKRPGRCALSPARTASGIPLSLDGYVGKDAAAASTKGSESRSQEREHVDQDVRKGIAAAYLCAPPRIHPDVRRNASHAPGTPADRSHRPNSGR